jgi:hypothetical protein
MWLCVYDCYVFQRGTVYKTKKMPPKLYYYLTISLTAADFTAWMRRVKLGVVTFSKLGHKF